MLILIHELNRMPPRHKIKTTPTLDHGSEHIQLALILDRNAQYRIKMLNV